MRNILCLPLKSYWARNNVAGRVSFQLLRVRVNGPFFGHKRTTAAIPVWRAGYLCEAR
jgi:hypothetical protein